MLRPDLYPGRHDGKQSERYIDVPATAPLINHDVAGRAVAHTNFSRDQRNPPRVFSPPLSAGTGLLAIPPSPLPPFPSLPQPSSTDTIAFVGVWHEPSPYATTEQHVVIYGSLADPTHLRRLDIWARLSHPCLLPMVRLLTARELVVPPPRGSEELIYPPAAEPQPTVLQGMGIVLPAAAVTLHSALLHLSFAERLTLLGHLGHLLRFLHHEGVTCGGVTVEHVYLSDLVTRQPLVLLPSTATYIYPLVDDHNYHQERLHTDTQSFAALIKLVMNRPDLRLEHDSLTSLLDQPVWGSVPPPVGRYSPALVLPPLGTAVASEAVAVVRQFLRVIRERVELTPSLLFLSLDLYYRTLAVVGSHLAVPLDCLIIAAAVLAEKLLTSGLSLELSWSRSGSTEELVLGQHYIITYLEGQLVTLVRYRQALVAGRGLVELWTQLLRSPAVYLEDETIGQTANSEATTENLRRWLEREITSG